MNAGRSPEYLKSLVQELVNLPKETEWAEFKVNDAEPKEIGEYLSALANSAALVGKANAFLVWGVQDADHQVVGTTFDPSTAKMGNEELENWLLRSLAPKINFHFHEVLVDAARVVVLEVERAMREPVQFQGSEFIRVGTYKKRLKDFPEKERSLWRIFDTLPFESGTAAEHVSDDDVLKLLDYPAYFDLSSRNLPPDRDAILQALAEERFIAKCPAGGWDIINLGAILFAKKGSDFPSLRRKTVRVIQYKGNSRADGGKEQLGSRGYAAGFGGLLAYVNGLLPKNEVIGQALRREVPMYPELAVRELIANALIHQDFFITGTGPMVEIFDDRVEITNPGIPLVQPHRFVDTPPRSRNEALASLMRRLGICEERGSGWDKVVAETELYQLPAPLAEQTDDHTRVALFAHKPLAQMDKEERIHACYLHACLKFVMRTQLTNSSLRNRFGIEEKNKAAVSRYIREAVDAGRIKPVASDAGRRYMEYVPFWA